MSTATLALVVPSPRTCGARVRAARSVRRRTLPARVEPGRAAPALARPIAAPPGSAVAGRTRLHLTRRGRLVVTALVLASLAAGAALLVWSGPSATAAGEVRQATSTSTSKSTGAAVASASASSAGAAAFRWVTVRPGDSLWSVAGRVAPRSDPRDVVQAVVDLNQLTSTAVTPGQRLAVPSSIGR